MSTKIKIIQILTAKVEGEDKLKIIGLSDDNKIYIYDNSKWTLYLS